ncbi:MAG: hypothetical protein HQ588_04810 [Deltaproteobacteria bacterium]|nr:hypothetical protein [Deltaproteobacteria bacterium]
MAKIFSSRLVTLLLISVLLLPCLLITPVMAVEEDYPYSATDAVVSDALNYLRSVQDNTGKIESFSASAWVVMAIAAAGEDPGEWKDDPSNPSIVDYLAANAATATAANAYSKMILAAVAAGEDPTDFGGRDFVALLEATHTGNQIGDGATLNDDFWGVLALVAAGKDPATSTIIQDSVAFILANQDAVDDGWGWGVGGGYSDVDNTAAAIMALIAAGQSPGSAAISDGLDYMKTTQQDNGGFLSWGDTNADTDSWGICGITAAGEVPTDWDSGTGNDPVDDLLTFQQTGDDYGAFYWQDETPGMSPAGTTAAAIIALLGDYFPVAVLEPEPPEEGVTVDIRIEGENDNIWDDSVTVDESWITADNSSIEYHLEDPTALGALDEAAEEGEFPYETTDEWGGLFVTSIDGEEGEGMAGWLYRIDYISPSVGAADFILDETSPPDPPHQEVLFYYGEWDDIPLKVEVDNAAPGAGDSFTVTVSEYDDAFAEWYLIENATVYADTSYTTDENGEVDITIYNNATIEVYAEKDGYIRSNPVTVVVGEGSSQQSEGQNVNMTVDIIPAISFSVSPDYINFGVLGPRDVSPPVTITVTNLGAWRLAVTTMVSDDAENLYVDGLKLNSLKWNEFDGTVSRDDSEEYVVTLTVPETYTLTGNQNGTIIFWASESPY